MWRLQTSENKEGSCLFGTWVINCRKCFHMLIPQDNSGTQEDKFRLHVCRQAPAHPASQVETFPLYYGYIEGESGKSRRVSKDRQRGCQEPGEFLL